MDFHRPLGGSRGRARGRADEARRGGGRARAAAREAEGRRPLQREQRERRPRSGHEGPGAISSLSQMDSNETFPGVHQGTTHDFGVKSTG